VTWGLMSLGWTLGYEGRLTEAYEAIEAAKATPGWRESNVLETEALVRWLAGDYLGSLRCGREVVMLNAGRIGLRRGLGPVCLALSGAEVGELAEAHRALATARQIYGSRVWFMASGLARHADGVVAWRDGRLPAALVMLQRAATELMSLGAPVFAAFVLADVAELAHQNGEPECARAAAVSLAAVALAVDRPLYFGVAETARAWAGWRPGGPVPPPKPPKPPSRSWLRWTTRYGRPARSSPSDSPARGATRHCPWPACPKQPNDSTRRGHLASGPRPCPPEGDGPSRSPRGRRRAGGPRRHLPGA